MRSCCCVNQCKACGQCCQVACAHRGGVGDIGITPKVTPRPLHPAWWWMEPPYGPQPTPPAPTRREPLTEEEVRRIIREELNGDA
jgi:hypothetical protein